MLPEELLIMVQGVLSEITKDFLRTPHSLIQKPCLWSGRDICGGKLWNFLPQQSFVTMIISLEIFQYLDQLQNMNISPSL